MYCQQCQEAKAPACTHGGVCGKDKVTAAYQDAVLYCLSGLCYRLNAEEKLPEPCIIEPLFATLTNVSFDKARFVGYLKCITDHRDSLPSKADEPEACSWKPANEEEIVGSEKIRLDAIADENERSLFSLLLFGVKGLAAYYSHAVALGEKNDAFLAFITKALASRFMKLSIEERTALVLECGKYGADVLALLDKANQYYGVPEITKVNTTPGSNPGIAVSGHDLKDLEMILKQTEGTGVDVYTHGEMLPAHAYPEFKKYKHFKGNYGTSWANQRAELESFGGPVVFTTNCIVPPLQSYKGRVFTTGAVGFPGCVHIPETPSGKDFSEVIKLAKQSPAPKDLKIPPMLTGCGHDAVLALAGKVIELVKAGKIRRFVVMAGCDGRDSAREYYTEFAKALPKDTVILTAGCAKYRYNTLDLGDIDGIPRVLDAGQCNDSYSLVVIASALAEAFGCGINDLPVSYNIAWYEQKAVLVLLVLLHLGVKNIMLGPSLPKFVSPAVLDLLVKTFGIQAASDVQTDLKKLNCI